MSSAPWTSQLFPRKGAHSKRRTLRLEPLEPRIALSSHAVMEPLTVPDAPTWVIEPYTLSDASVSMTVARVSGLEYYFRNVTNATHDSGWMTGTEDLAYITYVDEGLSPDTVYTYDVGVRSTANTGLEVVYSAEEQVRTLNAMEAAVQNLANQIRAIETFSNPDNPGQIVAQLAANSYPNPTAANSSECEQSGTNGLAAYPGDLRNTPGAFQVDLANMGQKDPANPAIEVFGEWKGTAGAAKKPNTADTRIALSAETLHDFFNIDVDADGLITHIEAAAASVFLHDDALAYAVATWNPDDNPLIGLHIDNFQSEQLSLYLASRDPSDGGVGVADARTSPPSVMRLAEALQYQVSKSFMWATYQKYLTHDFYKETFAKAVGLYGATLEITSSQGKDYPVLGIRQGETFKCILTPGFVLGGAYVSGPNAMFPLLTALVQANETGTGVWHLDPQKPDETKDVTFTLKTDGQSATDKVFSVNRTPLNFSENYPSIFHYCAVMSPFGMVDYTTAPENFELEDLISMTDADAWGFSGRNIDDGLGYTRLADAQTVSDTRTLAQGGRYDYTNLEAGKVLTLTGSDAFVVVGEASAAAGPKITANGYGNNANKSISAGQVVDISDFYDKDYVKTNADILNSSFYGWYDNSELKMARVTDSTVPTGKELFLYFVPAAKDEGPQGPQKVLDNQASFYDSGSDYYYCARIQAANRDVLGVATTADEWVTHFATQPAAGGTGVIDASATTGNVLIMVDDTIKTVKLGSGCTTVVAFAGNVHQKTYVFNGNASTAPTLDLRSGDVFDLSALPEGLTWTAGDATTYDNNVPATSTVYLRYSYDAPWTGTNGTATKAFRAIVRGSGNTGAKDPVKVVQNAINPLTVTVSRTPGQVNQTSESLLNFTVVFSEAVTDFDENDVTLGETAATVAGAGVAVTNPGGDRMTYSVAVTLKDTAETGTVVSAVGAGKVYDADGFPNLASTGTDNTVAYVPNTITGRETSGGDPLPGVSISLRSSAAGFTTRTTTTDGDGSYRFYVPDGAYQVTMTPPNACFNAGPETTSVTAENSQTYEADFSVGSLKPAAIPNRMMVTSSLPLGSAQWRQVVQEALGLGNEGGSTPARLNVPATNEPALVQYLALDPANASLAASDAEVAGEPDTAHAQGHYRPNRIARAIASPTAATDTPTVVASSNSPMGNAGNVNAAKTAQERAGVPEQSTRAALTPIVEEAIARWAEAGLDRAALDTMRSTTFVFRDLGGTYLGMTQANAVQLDSNAAGRGWFVDATPRDDEEFRLADPVGVLRAVDPRAVDRIDLLSVVAHELGHTAGLKDSHLGGLMKPSLQTGLRFSPSAHDAALASL